MTRVRHPSLYQVNTRVWLTSLSETLGRPAQLDDVPDVDRCELRTASKPVLCQIAFSRN